MKILNIHGYKGSAENSACLALKEMGFDVISPQIDYDAEIPFGIYADLMYIFNESNPDYVVGTSLGGFFAALIATQTGIPTVLVNPCLKPLITLSELGYTLNPLREMQFNRYDVIIKQIGQLDDLNITAIIGSQDDVISYHDTITRKLIRNCTVIPDGKHSGATLPLKEFFGETIK